MCGRVRRSKATHTDGTPVRPRGGRPAGVTTGRTRVYAGDAANPYGVYDATPGRSRDGPAASLSGYRGYRQADALGGDDGLYAAGVAEVACWADARRKWCDARDAGPARARGALARIRARDDVEARAEGLTAADRADLRRAEAVPRSGPGWPALAPGCCPRARLAERWHTSPTRGPRSPGA